MISSEQRVLIRYFWTETDRSATQIGAMFGVNKNVIMGTVTRAGWPKYRTVQEVTTADRAARRTSQSKGGEVRARPAREAKIVDDNELAEADYSNRPHRTFNERIDAIHAEMDRVLAECRV